MARNIRSRIVFMLILAGGIVLACDQPPANQPTEPPTSTTPAPDLLVPTLDSGPISLDPHPPLAEFRAIGQALELVSAFGIGLRVLI